MEKLTLLDTCTPVIIKPPQADGGEEKTWDYAVILQGGYHPVYTENSIRIFLNKNEELNMLIIVSVFMSSQTADLSIINPWVHLKDNQVVYLLIPEPSRSLFPDFWRTNHVNQNCQRLSTAIGLRYARDLNISLCLKIRADAFFDKKNSCKYLFEECLRDFPVVQIPHKPPVELKGRIVDADHVRQNWHVDGDHFLCDHWFFGWTEDLIKFFEVEKGKTCWDEGRGMKGYGFAETNLAHVWMKDLGIDFFPSGIIELSARYMGIAGMVELEFLCQKHKSYEEYQRRGKEYLEQIYREYFWQMPDYVTRQMWLNNVSKVKENPSMTF